MAMDSELPKAMEAFFKKHVVYDPALMKENKTIAKDFVMHDLQVILKNAVQNLPLSVGGIEKQGSAFEDLKVGVPNEFDFAIQYRIKNCRQKFAIVEGRTIGASLPQCEMAAGYWKIELKSSANAAEWSKLTDQWPQGGKQCLSPRKIVEHLQSAMDRAYPNQDVNEKLAAMSLASGDDPCEAADRGTYWRDQVINIQRSVRGNPALTISMTKKDGSVIDVDISPCIIDEDDRHFVPKRHPKLSGTVFNSVMLTAKATKANTTVTPHAPSVQCPHGCGKCFKKKAHSLQHALSCLKLNAAVTPPATSVQCPRGCGKCFKDKTSSLQHAESCPKLNAAVIPPTLPFQCPRGCGKCFKKKESSLQHAESCQKLMAGNVVEQLPVACPHGCGKYFTNNPSLRYHSELCSKLREAVIPPTPSVQCPNGCGKCFKDKASSLQHAESCLKLNAAAVIPPTPSVQCPRGCGKCFKDKASSLQHAKSCPKLNAAVIPPTLPFQCPRGCGKCFKKKESSLQHAESCQKLMAAAVIPPTPSVQCPNGCGKCFKDKASSLQHAESCLKLNAGATAVIPASVQCPNGCDRCFKDKSTALQHAESCPKLREGKSFNPSEPYELLWMRTESQKEKDRICKIDSDGGERRKCMRVLKAALAIKENPFKQFHSSYIVKTAWLHVVDQNPSREKWKGWELLASRMRDILIFLEEAFRQKKLLSRFNPQENILARLSDTFLSSCEGYLKSLNNKLRSGDTRRFITDLGLDL